MNTPSLAKKSELKLSNGRWDFPEQMGLPYYGFVYIVRDNILNRFYLGKKSYTQRKRGRTVISDWKQYNTSSELLKAMWLERPFEEFSFICLEQYKTKGTFNYAETWSLCHVDAPMSNMWYNTRIEEISWKLKEPVSQRHKERLAAVIAGLL